MSPSFISNLVPIMLCSVYSPKSNSSLFLDRPKGRMPSTLGARSFMLLPLHCGTVFQLIFGE